MAILDMASLPLATREAMMWRYIQERRGGAPDRREAIDFPCSSLWQAYYADRGLACPVGDTPRQKPAERVHRSGPLHITMVLPRPAGEKASPLKQSGAAQGLEDV